MVLNALHFLILLYFDMGFSETLSLKKQTIQLLTETCNIKSKIKRQRKKTQYEFENQSQRQKN